MMYGFDMERALRAMRAELTNHGVQELRTPEEVDAVLGKKEGTALVVVNSVCGCAAGAARPGVVEALKTSTVLPDHITTVFAGQDKEATARAREYFKGFAPSSPSVWLLKEGEVVFKLERHQIEHRSASDIAADIRTALQKHCNRAGVATA
ncbi:BrxA/BrxB family bacilliredoxin [Chloracidobacterium aggregatum]|jgi:putative YphP/YqiW family bacilliredoxin|uniref:BrxA/BrxB family bacilliredoxin n=1 Tax=Chloracidobacterium sp. N TaxID=2821540 RepID=A0ABX8AXM1_9BACT|nr:BrxA/BrxB family bacilliredoxin [Chloracidobacterium aggregatum]QUV84186.1 BrxA/BrxB family bacilliredoxin [Chloracidobacterium sp. 2]QUV87329.1 BrxA/BrxB family bacilliredoxin [Chloracidobacterium sp. S]QUV90233.1 BrxA/BrxB family bacilliredoxin [Chloracidobacterium sp. A]QUV93443.1 BrxA/BrxB family bacilliredoxin [Chloracidobacterium sp. N]QUV96600.1 BrxA/BrxB family bacilliredoxin [Chloracidobacterium sp. E]